MNALFKHHCWFCGRKSRDVVFVTTTRGYRYQCADGDACRARREAAERLLKSGPSDDYTQLLSGEIDPEEYVARVKAQVRAKLEAQRERRRA
jgi:hypothetical protein